MSAIAERDLVLPTLYLLAHTEEGLTTSELIQQLEVLLSPSGQDLLILAGRKDTRFSQKVRNLVSHRTLESQGLATREREDERNSRFHITAAGLARYHGNAASLDALLDFSIDENSNELIQLNQGVELEVLDEIEISEGQRVTRTSEYLVRSGQLRTAAIEHYSEGDSIRCTACSFEFALAYPDIGVGYIQIHHLVPISYLKGQTLSLSDALENVRPLCANCHAIVHKRRPPLSMAELLDVVNVDYEYQ